MRPVEGWWVFTQLISNFQPALKKVLPALCQPHFSRHFRFNVEPSNLFMPSFLPSHYLSGPFGLTSASFLGPHECYIQYHVASQWSRSLAMTITTTNKLSLPRYSRPHYGPPSPCHSSFPPCILSVFTSTCIIVTIPTPTLLGSFPTLHYRRPDNWFQNCSTPDKQATNWFCSQCLLTSRNFEIKPQSKYCSVLCWINLIAQIWKIAKIVLILVQRQRVTSDQITENFYHPSKGIESIIPNNTTVINTTKLAMCVCELKLVQTRWSVLFWLSKSTIPHSSSLFLPSGVYSIVVLLCIDQFLFELTVKDVVDILKYSMRVWWSWYSTPLYFKFCTPLHSLQSPPPCYWKMGILK